MKVREHRVDIEDCLFPVLVLEYDGKFYSFGSTIRSGNGIWDEIKDNLSSLVSVDDEDALDLLGTDEYFVREW